MTKPFIHDDFMLTCDEAVELYHRFAEPEPILDYHNHLSAKDIAENRRFDTLFDVWMDEDHYKWRAMRANGIEERLVTGDGDPKDKFLAFAATVPHTLRNPLYHWTHLELKRVFNIDLLLGPDTAEEVWTEANRQLADREDLRVQGLLKRFNVRALCTTDDPTDSLEHHTAIANDPAQSTAVFPAFRPDWAMFVDRVSDFNPWVERLGNAVGSPISSFAQFLDALANRHEFFHQCGARLSDHGMTHVPAAFCDGDTAASIFDAARLGVAATPAETEQFATYMLLFLARLDAEKGWTNQFHTGVWRNNNTRLFNQIGRDIGCDSMGDQSQGRSLQRLLDRLDQDDSLPKTIVYNLNPSDNYLISTMLGNFQGGTPGKMQFGSGWWYLDQKEGMRWQIDALSNTGLLSRFVGMLTDSRSFLSFIRHEYFRRVLCELLGNDMKNGELPQDMGLVSDLVRRICYQNAESFFGLPFPSADRR